MSAVKNGGQYIVEDPHPYYLDPISSKSIADIIKGAPLSVEEKAAAEVRASAQAKAADEAKAAAEAKAADEAKASSKGARDMAYQFKQTISSILKDEQFKNYTDMVDKLYDLNNPRVDQQLSGLTGSITTDIPRTCRSIKKYYLENFPNDDKLILDLTDDSNQEVKTIVKEYFPEKNGTLQFEKDCTAGNIFTTICKTKVLSRIKDFITKIKKALNLTGLPIPKSFKLKIVESRITEESIKSAYNFLSDTQKNDEDVIAFFEMCKNANVATGGRRSRYRCRPTKKYFKTRRHSSHKKKRHMKTKRHMKRHRKTKRHTMRH
jgi:hypothetical protein